MRIGSPTGSILTLRYNSTSSPRPSGCSRQFGTCACSRARSVSVINNQTAMLKVVENLVYFNISSQISQAQNVGPTLAIVHATPQLGPVGFVMNVTPADQRDDIVLLNVKPTISRC